MIHASPNYKQLTIPHTPVWKDISLWPIDNICQVLLNSHAIWWTLKSFESTPVLTFSRNTLCTLDIFINAFSFGVPRQRVIGDQQISFHSNQWSQTKVTVRKPQFGSKSVFFTSNDVLLTLVCYNLINLQLKPEYSNISTKLDFRLNKTILSAHSYDSVLSYQPHSYVSNRLMGLFMAHNQRLLS